MRAVNVIISCIVIIVGAVISGCRRFSFCPNGVHA